MGAATAAAAAEAAHAGAPNGDDHTSETHLGHRSRVR